VNSVPVKEGGRCGREARFDLIFFFTRLILVEFRQSFVGDWTAAAEKKTFACGTAPDDPLADDLGAPEPWLARPRLAFHHEIK